MPWDAIVGSGGRAFADYGTDGTFVRNVTERGLTREIGNQSTHEIFHCSENQEIGNKRSVDTFKVRHDHEYGDQLIPNGEMIALGTPPNATMPLWSVNGNVATVGDDFVSIEGVEQILGASWTPTESAATSTGIDVKEGESFTIKAELFFIDRPVHQQFTISLNNFELNEFYTLGRNGWVEGGVFSRFETDSAGGITYDIEVPPLPVDGNLVINFRQGLFHPDDHTISSSTLINSVTMTSRSGIIAGLEFTFKKTEPKREKVKDTDNIRIATSDNESLKNVFHDASGNQITAINFPFNGTNYSNLGSGHYITFVRAIMQQKKQREFFGDVFGDVPLLGSLDYIGISDNMVPIEHSYDSANNITTIRARQLDDTQDLDGEITEETVYSETVKPTIVS